LIGADDAKDELTALREQPAAELEVFGREGRGIGVAGPN
jgi:hypothetical protein